MTSTPPLLALKIDVDTLRGTREGVPALVQLLDRYRAGATFLFSIGPDHTGRALRRVFRRGFLRKVARTSVVAHYGVRTLLYGTLLPGPHIGRSCAGQMRAVRSAGFEVGLHSYDHVRWQDLIATRGPEWTRREMQRGLEAFHEVFGAAPEVHGAAGWQMNAAAFEAEAAMGLRYASDTRGTHPFQPVMGEALLACPQLPTTLPTLDELIGVNRCTPAGAAARLLELTCEAPMAGHVYTLHAELEGMRLQPVLATLLAGWRAQGYRLVAMRSLLENVETSALPRHRIESGTVPGRSGPLTIQGKAVAGACLND
jgi:peptidoglycan/xylan/chitin deacetylase (PgdA/CDA1 family)